MANEKKNGNGGATNGAGSGDDGFVRVGSVANAPWLELKKGNKLHAILQNVYERPDERTPTKTSKFFQLELLEDAPARIGRGENAKVVQAKKGAVVNLNYGPKTKELEKFIPDILRGAIFHVKAEVGDKFPISKGRSMWDVDVKVKLVRGPRPSEDEVDFAGDDDGEGAGAAA